MRHVLVSVDVADVRAYDTLGILDLAMCFCVLDLVPSRRHAADILESVLTLLRPGAPTVVLVKYAKSVGALRLAASHEGRLGRLTTFAMPDIWWRMTELGFNVNLVELFDIDGLDRNYAYYQRSKRC